MAEDTSAPTLGPPDTPRRARPGPAEGFELTTRIAKQLSQIEYGRAQYEDECGEREQGQTQDGFIRQGRPLRQLDERMRRQTGMSMRRRLWV